MLKNERPSDRWHGFLLEIDEALEETVALDCIGGFVVTQLYGSGRATGDLDFVEVAPGRASDLLTSLGVGKGGLLSRKHKLYLDYVGVSSYPYEYESRLVEMFPGLYRHLRLLAMDPYDIVLSKLTRDQAKDREDVLYLARIVPFDLALLQSRFEEEMLTQIFNEKEARFVLAAWMELILEDRQASDVST